MNQLVIENLTEYWGEDCVSIYPQVVCVVAHCLTNHEAESRASNATIGFVHSRSQEAGVIAGRCTVITNNHWNT